MKNTLVLAFATILAAAAPLFSQNEKGINPIAHPSIAHRPPTIVRAVVIGISDYQEKDIPDLRFADRDAEAFANFLRSPAGGSLDNDHLQILTNQNATAGQVAAALDALVEQAKEGEEVIIYFSGHGDVERKTISQPGFLLCWDAPSRVYMGGGTYSLAFLQEIVSTLSTQNKAKVVVVTDACHAGKLAGTQIGGAQLTAANLAKQFSNEVKILSCQPGELSLEGEQWGGGRGIFSFHLVDGLFGLADRNGDGQVSLGEIDRYLEDKVTAEAAPQSQVPMLLGNKTERLATVNASILADLKKSKAAGLPVFAATEGRGFEDEILAKADSSVRAMFFAFKKAVREKRFFEPADDCAEVFYASLSIEQELAPLYGFMKRNYAAALQDEAQQEMNTMLKTGLTREVLAGKKSGEIYRQYPAWLDRAAGLLGSGHYMYTTLMARKSFFEGKISPKPTERKSHFQKALEWQPDLPHAYLELVSTCQATETDSANFYAAKAMELAPRWTMPYIRLASFNEHKMKNLGAAEPLLKQAHQLDSGSVIVWYEIARFYDRAAQYDVAEQWFKKVLASSGEGICFPCAVNQMAYVYFFTDRLAEAEASLLEAIRLDSTVAYLHNTLAYVYLESERYAEAEPFLKKALGFDSTFVMVYINLIRVYAELGQLAQADAARKKLLQLDSTSEVINATLATSYAKLKRFAEAEAFGKKCIELYPLSAGCRVRLASVYASANRKDEAVEALEQSLEIGYDYGVLQGDPALVPLRALPEWKVLMKKYFTDKVKD